LTRPELLALRSTNVTNSRHTVYPSPRREEDIP
jgi:hypothetical protein